MERAFIQTEEFSDQLKDLPHPDELLLQIEQEILRDLLRPAEKRDVLVGTGGFAKVRVPLKSERRGKSGSVRVIYIDCPASGLVIMVMLYRKNRMENISAAGREALKKKAKEFKAWVPEKRK